jgi:hypothetical protein
VAVLVAGTGVGATAGDHQPSRTMVDERIGSLLSQSQYVAGVDDATFQMTLFVEGESTLGSAAPTDIVITSYEPVESRQAVRQAISGEFPDLVDSLVIPVESANRSSSGMVDLSIPIEIDSRSQSRLQLPDAGLIPITIGLQVDRTITNQLVTFVERLPDQATVPEPVVPLGAAVVGAIEGSLTLAPDSTTVVADADRALLGNAAAAAESSPGTPISIAFRPELLEGLSRSTEDDLGLLERLRAATSLAHLATTYVDLDVTAATSGGLGEVFTDQVRLGEDALRAAFPGTSVQRGTWLQASLLSATGAQKLRDLGFTTVLMSAVAQEKSGLGALLFADPTRLTEMRLPSGATIQAALVDVHIANLLTLASAGDPTDAYLVAQQVLAEVKMMRREILDRGEGFENRTVFLSTVDGDLPTIDVLLALIDTLSASGLVEFVDVDTAIDDTSLGLIDGRPFTIDLQDVVDESLLDLGSTMNDLIERIDAFASMLPDGDERPGMWRRLLDVIPDASLSADGRQVYADVVAAQTAELAASIVPPENTTFTLGGRDSSVRVTLRNDSATDLTVRVRLTSAKLEFPAGDSLQVLPAGATTSVEIPVRAKSNGRFPVVLQLLTPRGDVAIAPPTTFTARVNALAGLGQLVTGVLLLLLATWWVHHLRGRRKSRGESK